MIQNHVTFLHSNMIKISLNKIISSKQMLVILIQNCTDLEVILMILNQVTDHAHYVITV